MNIVIISLKTSISFFIIICFGAIHTLFDHTVFRVQSIAPRPKYYNNIKVRYYPLIIRVYIDRLRPVEIVIHAKAHGASVDSIG